jgi:ElaB/YqjD/DUF883 family membrane-anchored ribosome-binding protein
MDKEQIREALELLEDTAKSAKQDLRSLITDKYANLKDTIIENEQALVERLFEAKDVTLGRAKGVAHDVDGHAHKNPWLYMSGVAVVGLLLGFILGHRHD